jgi:hypothetical protein
MENGGFPLFMDGRAVGWASEKSGSVYEYATIGFRQLGTYGHSVAYRTKGEQGKRLRGVEFGGGGAWNGVETSACSPRNFPR